MKVAQAFVNDERAIMYKAIAIYVSVQIEGLLGVFAMHACKPACIRKISLFMYIYLHV
jgi:hypothetical protein